MSEWVKGSAAEDLGELQLRAVPEEQAEHTEPRSEAMSSIDSQSGPRDAMDRCEAGRDDEGETAHPDESRFEGQCEQHQWKALHPG